ncbi:hypothetical protein AB4Y32_16260 [Paraburkholderia phymatum]|uniref:Uncharacterized protein n=1 Tax=Paraburkholderia phymatum TaxID=148447 RepID=A0ACC6U0Y2_9BURK
MTDTKKLIDLLRDASVKDGMCDVAATMIEQQAARIAELEAALTVPDYAMPPDGQEWAKVIPEVAFHLIERHAENWAHAGQLMEAWRDATAKAPEPIWCQSCGDGITAHDPGVCGNCFAMKYRDAYEDAARYQFLKRQAKSDPKMDGRHVWYSIPMRNPKGGTLTGSTLDEAIDAAIASTREQTE